MKPSLGSRRPPIKRSLSRDIENQWIQHKRCPSQDSTGSDAGVKERGLTVSSASVSEAARSDSTSSQEKSSDSILPGSVSSGVNSLPFLQRPQCPTLRSAILGAEENHQVSTPRKRSASEDLSIGKALAAPCFETPPSKKVTLNEPSPQLTPLATPPPRRQSAPGEMTPLLLPSVRNILSASPQVKHSRSAPVLTSWLQSPPLAYCIQNLPPMFNPASPVQMPITTQQQQQMLIAPKQQRIPLSPMKNFLNTNAGDAAELKTTRKPLDTSKPSAKPHKATVQRSKSVKQGVSPRKMDQQERIMGALALMELAKGGLV